MVTLLSSSSEKMLSFRNFYNCTRSKNAVLFLSTCKSSKWDVTETASVSTVRVRTPCAVTWRVAIFARFFIRSTMLLITRSCGKWIDTYKKNYVWSDRKCINSKLKKVLHRHLLDPVHCSQAKGALGPNWRECRAPLGGNGLFLKAKTRLVKYILDLLYMLHIYQINFKSQTRCGEFLG